MIKTMNEFEEVKKEWEELGYEMCQGTHYIGLRNEKKRLEIVIQIKDKYYFKRDNQNFWEIITFQEHNLLTRTFKALGWL